MPDNQKKIIRKKVSERSVKESRSFANALSKEARELFRDAKSDELPLLSVKDSRGKLVEIDKFLTKVANIEIFRPTPENVESFVKDYFIEELKPFPDEIPFSINFIPINFTESDDDEDGEPLVQDGEGVVLVYYGDKTLELPFRVSNGLFVPFDTIRHGDEGVYYSRENLQKILNHMGRNQGEDESIDPYEDVVNEDNKVLRDEGFLDDVLSIRSTQGVDGVDNSYWATASEKCDDFLEKLSNLRVVDTDKLKEAFSLVKKDMVKNRLDKIDKLAEDEGFSKDILDSVTNFSDLKFLNLENVEPGTYVKFPEGDDGLSMKKGYIGEVTDTILPLFESPDDKGDSKKIVITIDGKYKVFNPGDKFLSLLDGEPASWEVIDKATKVLKQGKTYTAFMYDGVTFSYPFVVDSIRSGSQYSNLKLSKIYECRSLNTVGGTEFIFGVSPKPSVENIAVDKDTYINMWLDVEGSGDKIDYYKAMIPKDKPIVLLQDGALYVELKGKINNYLIDKDELYFEYTEDFLKSATLSERVQIDLVSRDEKHPRFHIDIKWLDNDKKIFRTRRKKFQNASHGKAAGVLKSCGYSYQEASEGLTKAKLNGRSVLEITDAHTPDQVSEDVGGDDMGRVKQRVQKSSFNPAIAETLLANILGEGIKESLPAEMSGFEDTPRHQLTPDQKDALDMFKLVDKVGCNESFGVAASMEKIAVKKQNDTLLGISKMLVAKHKFEDFLVKCAKGKDSYFGVEDLIKTSGNELVDTMEKAAEELVELKHAQISTGNEVVPMTLIHGTLKQFDQFKKLIKAE